MTAGHSDRAEPVHPTVFHHQAAAWSGKLHAPCNAFRRSAALLSVRRIKGGFGYTQGADASAFSHPHRNPFTRYTLLQGVSCGNAILRPSGDGTAHNAVVDLSNSHECAPSASTKNITSPSGV